MNARSDTSISASLESLEILVSELESVLAKEHQALRERATDALENTVRHKAELVQQIDQITRAMLNALALKPGIDSERLSKAIAATGNGQHWQALQTRLATCQKENRNNGLLIEAGRHLNQNLLDILRGTVANGTYSAKGQLGGQFSGGAIAEA